jgi:nucleoside-triphosphatase THEP1
MSVIIFSAPVHSGKTTTLMNWCRNKNNVGGLLMPDVNGTRKFLNIETKEVFDAECTKQDQCTEKLVSIGQYNFYETAFAKANNILLNISPSIKHIIIDEIGKLELQQKGLYEGTTHLLSKSNQCLILVVRDSLVEAVATAFNLNNYSLIHKVEEIPY